MNKYHEFQDGACEKKYYVKMFLEAFSHINKNCYEIYYKLRLYNFVDMMQSMNGIIWFAMFG